MKTGKLTILIFVLFTFCFLNISTAQWEHVSNGLGSGQLRSVAASGNTIIAAVGSSVFLSTNSGTNWTQTSTINGLNVICVLIDGNNFFAGTGSSGTGGVYRSTNNGLSWVGTLNNRFISKMAKKDNILYAAASDPNLIGDGLYRSINNGVNWTRIFRPLGGVFKLDVNGNNIFLEAGKLYRSINNGGSWDSTSFSNASIATNENTFFVGSNNNGIYKSTNNGANFFLSGLSNVVPITLLAKGIKIYAATQGSVYSVYFSTNNGTNWTERNEGLGNQRVNCFEVSDSYIFAGTQSNGVYRMPRASVNQPAAFEKWASGEPITIQWAAKDWTNVNVKCVYNADHPTQETDTILATNIPNISVHIWLTHPNILSFRSKIVVENASNPSEKIESDIFRIKPYLLTRVNPDSTYYDYRKNRDQWGFWNHPDQMFPSKWYSQFNYQGIDPFTGLPYSQRQGFFTYRNARDSNFTDWVSFVNTFTVNSCYWNTTLGIYKQLAVLKWSREKYPSWKGSCFGIAIANGIVFRNKNEFAARYPSFPSFTVPDSVISTSTNSVKKDINELFTHQIGQPHKDYRSVAQSKTPTQTLNEIKDMLLSENDPVRIIVIEKNSDTPAAHAILPFKVLRDPVQTDKYYIYVYDNAIPNSNVPFIVNTSANGGNGSWSTTDWPEWGGDKWMYLMDPANSYLVNPTTNIVNEKESPFILNDSLFEVSCSQNASVVIKDTKGNITGFINDSLYLNIPGSSPLIYANSSESPPYGYDVPIANYSVLMSNFSADTVDAFFFTGNKTFSYERNEASQAQTDRLYFDGGLSVVNPDTENKEISLLNLMSEITNEKLFLLRSIDLLQNDSVKIENEQNDNLKLISYGSPKNYDIELNMAKETELVRFGVFNVSLPENSSHTLLPNWNNIYTSQLVIYEDLGNNGTIDDTIRLNNQVGVNGNGSVYLPENYSLSQNYPNPFNPTTVIKFDIKYKGNVTLKVYSILGAEVATLVNEVKQSGSYEIEFDGTKYSSGVYYYKMEVGDFADTKKMILIK